LDIGIHLAQQAAFGGIGLVVGIGGGALVTVLSVGEIGFAVAGPIGAGVGTFLGALLGFLGIFGGGGPHYPAWYIREVRYQGGNVVTFIAYNGGPQGLAVDEKSSANVVPAQEIRNAQSSHPGSFASKLLDCYNKHYGTAALFPPTIGIAGALTCGLENPVGCGAAIFGLGTTLGEAVYCTSEAIGNNSGPAPPPADNYDPNTEPEPPY
jgi:hypothetical protein